MTFTTSQSSVDFNFGSGDHFLPAVPLLSREKFAITLGVSRGVVEGWANKGLIPLIKIGKYSLVNVELLRRRCLEKEFK